MVRRVLVICVAGMAVAGGCGEPAETIAAARACVHDRLGTPEGPISRDQGAQRFSIDGVPVDVVDGPDTYGDARIWRADDEDEARDLAHRLRNGRYMTIVAIGSAGVHQHGAWIVEYPKRAAPPRTLRAALKSCVGTG